MVWLVFVLLSVGLLCFKLGAYSAMFAMVAWGAKAIAVVLGGVGGLWLARRLVAISRARRHKRDALAGP